MRKFLLSPGIWSSLFPIIGLARTTKDGPRDWRLILMWASWGIGLALAVGTVFDRSRSVELEQLAELQERERLERRGRRGGRR